jgi:hypothetical protein
VPGILESFQILVTQLNLHQRLAFWLFGLLLLTKFSPVAALLTVSVVSLQVVLGESLVARFSGFNHLSSLAKVGLGFCLGAITSTFIYVFFVTLSNALVASLSQILVFVCAVLLRVTQTRSANSFTTREELGAVKWLAVIALLGLSPNWFWTLPVAIWLAVLFLTWPRIKPGSIALKLVFATISCLSGLFIWLRILDTRPDRPWFADDRFAELFSFSLGKWGMTHNPMLISENISYHWFSFAWIGVLSNLSGTKIDVAFALFGPTIVAMACAVLGFAIIKTFKSNATIAICSLALAVFVDTERLFEGYGFNAFQLSSFSQFFSLALGLALLLIVITCDDEQLSSVSVIVGIVFAALIGAKISSGLVAGFGLGGVWLADLFRQRRIIANLKFLIIGLIGPSIFSLIIFYGDPRNGSGSLFRRPAWVVGVSQDLWDVYNGNFLRYFPILLFLIMALGGLGLMGLLVILRSKFDTVHFSKFQIFLSFGLVGSLAQMWIRGGAGSKNLMEGNVNTLYAFHFWISLTRFVAVALVLQQVSILWRSQKLRILILIVGFLYLSAIFMVRSWDINYEPSYIIPLLTTFKPAIPFFLCLLLATLLSVLIGIKWKSLGSQSSPKSFLALSNIALIAAGLCLSFANNINVSDRQQKEWRSMDTEYSVSSDFEDATNWLKINMRRDDVLASKVTRSSPQVAVLTEHKDFAGVPMSFRIFGEHSVIYETNYKLIDEFSTKGTCESATAIDDAGADFFLIDLSNLETPDIPRCAIEVFRNKGAIVYKLS